MDAILYDLDTKEMIDTVDLSCMPDIGDFIRMSTISDICGTYKSIKYIVEESEFIVEKTLDNRRTTHVLLRVKQRNSMRG